MSAQTDRNLGGIGSILVLLGVIGTIINVVRYAFPSTLLLAGLSLVSGLFGLLSFVGWLLFLVAMYNLSKYYNERRIINYIVYGFAAAFVAAIIVGVAFAMFAIGTILGSSSFPLTGTSSIFDSLGTFSPIFGVVGLVYIVFKLKALNLVSAKTQISLFSKSALVFVVGAIVQIAVSIGLVIWASASLTTISLFSLALVSLPGGLIQYVAWAMLAKAFYSIKPSQIPVAAYAPVYPSSSASAVAGQTKYCIHCGAANSPDMTYCIKCGKKQ